MSVIQHALSAVELGSPTHFGAITLFPLIGSVSTSPGYLMLDEALNGGLCEIGEVSEGGVVAELQLDNLAELPILLLDGEEVAGAKQNRILNLTVLCAASRRTTLPVSCVEQGRWSYRSRKFRSAGRSLFSSARAAKMRSVSASIVREGSRRSNQGEVWDHVDSCLRDHAVSSDTGASEAAYDAALPATEAYAMSLPPQESQVGAVYAINGQVIALELLDNPASYAKVHRKLLESLVVDVGARSTATPDAFAADKEAARLFIEEVRVQDCGRYEAVGLGHDLRIETTSLAGAALEFSGHVLHLSAFRVPRRETRSRH